MFLFNINKKGTIVLCADAIKLCPEFSILKEEEVRFLVLVYDYNSPFHQLPEDERIQRAKNQVYGAGIGVNTGEKRWKHAVELYKALQYSPKQEMIRIYNKKLQVLTREMENADTARAIENIIKSQTLLRKVLDEITNEYIKEEEERIRLIGGGKLSFIQDLMRNKEDYNRVKNKKVSVPAYDDKQDG